MLVFTGGPHCPSPRAMNKQIHRQHTDGDESPAHDHQPERTMVVAEISPAVPASVDGVEVEKVVGELLNAEHSAGNRLGPVAAHHLTENLGEGNCGNGQIIQPQPQRGDPQKEAHHKGCCRTAQNADHKSCPRFHGNSGPVGSRRHSHHMPVVPQACIAELKVQPQPGQSISHSRRPYAGAQCSDRDVNPVHDLSLRHAVRSL